MAQQSGPIPVDPQAVERSEQGWHVFTQYGKYLAGGVFVLLILMAIFLI